MSMCLMARPTPCRARMLFTFGFPIPLIIGLACRHYQRLLTRCARIATSSNIFKGSSGRIMPSRRRSFRFPPRRTILILKPSRNKSVTSLDRDAAARLPVRAISVFRPSRKRSSRWRSSTRVSSRARKSITSLAFPKDLSMDRPARTVAWRLRSPSPALPFSHSWIWLLPS